MTAQTLSPDVDALTRILLGPLPAGTYPPVVLAIVATALTEIGMPAEAQRCELLTQTNTQHGDYHADGIEINGITCGFDSGTTLYGWDALITHALALEGKTVDGYEIRRVMKHDLDISLRYFTNNADPAYLNELLDDVRSRAQEWKLNQDTTQDLPRAARRVGL